MAEDAMALVDGLIALCREAGEAIMAVYQQNDLSVAIKSDDSPVTEADQQAHRVIANGLVKLLDIPVLSEEGDLPTLAERQQWSRYWLVDPLDGTKEFIARTDQFTVNIALIEDHAPILGIIYAPVDRAFYFGGKALRGSWQKCDMNPARPIYTRPCAPTGQFNMTISRNRGMTNLESLHNHFQKQFAEVHTIVAGSSLKACLVAEGTVDIYPRRGPTSEWDTAAAQAVVEGAGGMLVDDGLQPLRYNQSESLENPNFYVLGDPTMAWKELLQL